MKNLEFKELSNKEILEINGGGVGILDCGVIAAGIVVAAGVAVMRDWENFKAGLAGGPPAN